MHNALIRPISFLFIASVLAHLFIWPAYAQNAGEVKALNSRVGQLRNQGQYAEAIKLAKRALSLAEKAIGQEHPDTLKSLNNLVELHKREGRHG